MKFRLPARHLASPVLGRVRVSTTVRTVSLVVAVARLALVAYHRLAAAIAPSQAVPLSRFVPSPPTALCLQSRQQRLAVAWQRLREQYQDPFMVHQVLRLGNE